MNDFVFKKNLNTQGLPEKFNGNEKEEPVEIWVRKWRSAKILNDWTEDQAQLLEWFANNYKTFGTTLQIVTDKSQEGSQFCKGFGGIGG